MERKQALRIVACSTLALVIPILGQLFMDGWNWTWHDFAFAWVFFNILGLTYTFVTNKITHKEGRMVAGALVVAVFVFIWVMLATG